KNAPGALIFVLPSVFRSLIGCEKAAGRLQTTACAADRGLAEGLGIRLSTRKNIERFQGVTVAFVTADKAFGGANIDGFGAVERQWIDDTFPWISERLPV